MNNYGRSGIQVIKKGKKKKRTRRGKGKRGKNTIENNNNSGNNFHNRNSKNQNNSKNFFQENQNSQNHSKPQEHSFSPFNNQQDNIQRRGPLTLDSLYEKYPKIDPSIILNIYNNSEKDVILTDFQLKEMALDMFPSNSKEKPPPEEQRGFNPFGNFELSPLKLDKRISGMSTGVDENSSSYNDFESPLTLSKNSSSVVRKDEEYLDFLEENAAKGDDITKEDLTNIIKVVRKSIGEEADIDGNDYLLEQYMNDMVLVQSFIESKLARDKAKNMSKDGVSIHSRQDFPTLGGGSKNKKKKHKPRKRKKGREQQPKIQTPFDKVKVKKYTEKKEELVDMIEKMKREKKEQEERKDLERKEKGIIGGFTVDDRGFKGSGGVKKSQWNCFEKDLFFTGSSESQHIFFTLHSMFPRIMLGRLKLFYTQLGQSLNQTKHFLMTEFREYYRPGTQLPNQGVQNPNFVKIGSTFNPQNDDDDFDLNEAQLRELKRMDTYDLNSRFSELRTKVRNLQKVYYLCSKHGKAARSKKDHQRASNFLNHRRKTEMDLDCLKEESVYIAYEICRRHDFKKLDLHGLYLEEAEEVVMLVINKVKKIQRVNRRSRDTNRNFYLEIVTGRGRHSKNNKAVLFPKIKSYLESDGYTVKTSRDNGRIIVKL